MLCTSITDAEFLRVSALVHRVAGIKLGDTKKALVVGRLSRRLAHLGIDTFGQYMDLLARPDARAELQAAIDLLTTNETNFFREPRHFDFLKQEVLPSLRHSAGVRIWSAACSTGEEPYTVAMMLQEVLGDQKWEVLATDLSTRTLEETRRGHYPMARAAGIPKEYLRKYCLKGKGPQADTFLIERALRARVHVRQLNLIEPLPDVGRFHAIFLRNVMIYFDTATKVQVVARLANTLLPGGYFFVGHCESLNGVNESLIAVRPAIYMKPAA